MFKKLHFYYIKQRFILSWVSVLINPFFLIRLGLYRNVKKYAVKLEGDLLDFGCGSKPYRSLFHVNKYVGLDVEVSGHEHIGEEKDTIDVFYDGKTIPFEADSFDSCFSSEVFEHVFNLPEMLGEINRVLKKDALMLVTVPFVWEEHEIPYDFGRYSSYGIKHLLKEKGFEVVSFEKSGKSIHVIIQLWIMYIHNFLYTKNKYINILITLLFISPFTILGLILGFILPNNNKLYFNNIVLVKKTLN